jgi:hypothetical protein
MLLVSNNTGDAMLILFDLAALLFQFKANVDQSLGKAQFAPLLLSCYLKRCLLLLIAFLKCIVLPVHYLKF